MDRIDTYKEFKRFVVEPDFRDFMDERDNLRKAWHCAGSLFHLADWVYVAHKSSIDRKYQFVDDHGRTQPVSCASEFANYLGQTHPDFQLMRGIANSSKHFVLRAVPPGRVNPPGMPSHAANTYVSMAWRVPIQCLSDWRSKAAREPRRHRVRRAGAVSFGYVGQPVCR